MKTAYFHFLFLLITWLPGEAGAQFIFQNLKPRDGLSTREVQAVYQDKEGFMWMGTLNGLNRYDGSRFAVWNKSSPQYPSQLGESVTAIIERKPGEICFGTTSGIAIFDKSTRTITDLPVEAPHLKGDKLNVTQLIKDDEDRIWVSSTRGLYYESEGKLKPVSSLFPFAAELDSSSCLHSGFIYDTSRKVFWLASQNGMYCLDPSRKQLFSVNNNPKNFPIYTKNSLNSIAIGKKNEIWFGDATINALMHFDFSAGKLDTIRRINNNPLWELGGGCNMLFMDDKERLWISTWLFALFVRYPDGKFERIQYDDKLPYSIGYGFIYDAKLDSYGNTWFGTLNGVSKISASGYIENIIHATTAPYYLPVTVSNINDMRIDKNGNWWLGKLEGLQKYEPSTGKLTLFVPFPSMRQENSIRAVELIESEIWCATGDGIVALNPSTGKFRRIFPKDPKITRQSITRIYPDTKGYVWFVCWGDAVYRFNKQSGEFLRFVDPDKPEEFIGKVSHGLLETSDDKMWISNAREGIRIFDYRDGKIYPFPHNILKEDYVYSMTQDKEGNIWVSTDKHGLLQFNFKGQLIDSISGNEGLPLARYDHLTIDKEGRIWTKSREALFCIFPKGKQVTRVAIDVNFSFNDHWNKLYLKDGKLYATMLDNVVVINPEKFRRSTLSGSPLFSDFRVFQKERAFNPGKKITLSYNENFFSVDYSSPFHHEDGFIEYAYKLEGFDKDWVYSGRNRTAAYTNVPDGEYTFIVKTKDASGQWSEKTSRLSIEIIPPFWKTSWFFSLSAIMFTGVGYSVYRHRRKRKRRHHISRTIDYFANSVYGENSVNEICWDIARNCISQLQFEDCVVYLFDVDRNRLIQKAAYGPKNPKGHEIVNPIEINPGEGIVGAVAITGKPLLIPDTTKDPRYIIDDERRLSELAVPILHDGKVIGVIDSEHSQRNFFNDEHVKAMITIASISANKIAEAQAEEYARVNEIKLLEIQKLLAESQLMALRAQMNPHFVFNCLNSIQECIVMQKYGEASKYLNKFSKLFRMVLNNSGRNLISLHEETEMLELYLELEQMRFENSFEYKISRDEDLEAEDVLIPSMLLQPYVENALWHGLMHKKGDRLLQIIFEKITDSVFRCTVDDNGIGRNKSFDLKEQQSKSKRHESKGLRISSDRIDLLRKQGDHAAITIIDKVNEAGESLGTRVVIELSTFLKN